MKRGTWSKYVDKTVSDVHTCLFRHRVHSCVFTHTLYEITKIITNARNNRSASKSLVPSMNSVQ